MRTHLFFFIAIRFFRMPLKQLFGTIRNEQMFEDEHGRMRMYNQSMIDRGIPEPNDAIVYEENGRG